VHDARAGQLFGLYPILYQENALGSGSLTSVAATSERPLLAFRLHAAGQGSINYECLVSVPIDNAPCTRAWFFMGGRNHYFRAGAYDAAVTNLTGRHMVE